ncbi:polysaccharide lyase family 1 protein [Pseudarthrobacter sp. B4EP4b]|uniref:pectate lyase family protein n=1 Tax=Pseudarthrobacter sp. B4EP4b TaxID=2590664 RepID=UPI002102882D|nr:pectate lyase [Pseudarthrobacter sp. B4EP4b]
MTSKNRTRTFASCLGNLRRGAAVAASASAFALAAGLAVAAPGVASPAPAGGGVIKADDSAPTGWAAVGSGTNGGAGAPAENRYKVSTLAGLKAALGNHGEPKAPKIIYISGTIDGNQTSDGRILGEQDYAPGYNINKYMSCFGPEGKAWSDQTFDYCKQQRQLRQTGSNNMKRQIEVSLPSNTTLIGVGADSGFVGTNIVILSATNVVVRNLSVEAPVDFFTTWSPDDGEGAWNSRFDSVSSVTSDHLWIDHVRLTDGRFPDSEAPMGFRGKRANRHDGLLDLKDGTDFVTISNSRLSNHDKTMLLGSGDEHVDKDGGKLRVSYIGNYFENIQQRGPRVRFGQVHVLNNYFAGSTDHPQYPMISEAQGGNSYFLGAGYESRIFSERNAFEYTGPGADPSIMVSSYNGHRFNDVESWYNGAEADLNQVARTSFEQNRAEALAEAGLTGEAAPDWTGWDFTTDVGWNPADAYSYKSFTTAQAVKNHALRFTGPGVLTVKQ